MPIDKTGSSINKIPVLYYKDFYEWPQHWMGFKEDIDLGNRILLEFIPFIEFLVDKKLARSTIKKYMSDLGVLGSEIIRRIHENENQRKWPANKILLDYLDESGGPIPHCWDPNEFTQQRYITAYDSTCRNFYKFINNKK
jgi:hypothetical protein